MNAKKAYRKFAQIVASAPPGASLTIGVSWIETRGWQVMMSVDTALLHLGAAAARGLAGIYDKHHRSAEWRGRRTGLEWVAPNLRKLADEVDQKNVAGAIPPEMLGHIAMEGRA